jgi:FKBP-type peptidyl-prolyl cis-trans isomerase
MVMVHYRGTLEDGTEFDSSYSRNEPFQVLVGAGGVIPGWELGLQKMRVGGKAILTIPPNLGYGDREIPGIPANSTLIFEVEVVELVAPPAQPAP